MDAIDPAPGPAIAQGSAACVIRSRGASAVAHRRLLAGLAALALGGCAPMSMEQAGRDHGTAIGCAGGALLGAVLGAGAGNSRTALQGAALGLAAGCAVGAAWQSHQQALDRIAQEERIHIEMETLSSTTARRPPVPGSASHEPSASAVPAGFVAQVRDQGMFPVGSDQLSADGLRQVQKIGAAFAMHDGADATALPTSLLVVGHTDATGSAESNQALSEARARTVGQVLARAGTASTRIYYQGAGASRPLADNDSVDGRAINRRVEIVELASVDLLKQRVVEEHGNPRYLSHGTQGVSGDSGTVARRSTAPVPGAPAAPAAPTASAASAARAPVSPPGRQVEGVAVIDFGGIPADRAAWIPAEAIAFKRTGGGLISSAYAANAPMRSCQQDRPRVDGVAKQLASGAPLELRPTRAYLGNMNGRPWAGLVNGHQITLSPVWVLSEGAEVTQPPRVLVVEGYSQGNRKLTARLNAQASAYEGENAVLYRVFISGAQAPVSCLDVVLPKDGSVASAGKLYYLRATRTAYAADFAPAGF